MTKDEKMEYDRKWYAEHREEQKEKVRKWQANTENSI